MSWCLDIINQKNISPAYSQYRYAGLFLTDGVRTSERVLHEDSSGRAETHKQWEQSSAWGEWRWYQVPTVLTALPCTVPAAATATQADQAQVHPDPHSNVQTGAFTSWVLLLCTKHGQLRSYQNQTRQIDLIQWRPHGKESTEVQETQQIGKERENSY